MADNTCHNCGKHDIAKDGTCNQCGYKPPVQVQLDPMTLVYCETCGNSYTDKCAKGHEVVKVDLNKKGS